jgi:hypothetical protein
MAGLFKFFWTLATGKVVARSDTAISGGGCVLSLRLKRDERAGTQAIVLAVTPLGGLGYYGFYPLELNELDRFVEAANEIRAAFRSGASGSPSRQ